MGIRALFVGRKREGFWWDSRFSTRVYFFASLQIIWKTRRKMLGGMGGWRKREGFWWGLRFSVWVHFFFNEIGWKTWRKKWLDNLELRIFTTIFGGFSSIDWNLKKKKKKKLLINSFLALSKNHFQSPHFSFHLFFFPYNKTWP